MRLASGGESWGTSNSSVRGVGLGRGGGQGPKGCLSHVPGGRVQCSKGVRLGGVRTK